MSIQTLVNGWNPLSQMAQHCPQFIQCCILAASWSKFEERCEYNPLSDLLFLPKLEIDQNRLLVHDVSFCGRFRASWKRDLVDLSIFYA